jgi:hypothetical protein
MIIYNKDSFDNAVEVDNYPWGFKLKTRRRYWIETKKNRGDRFCYSTLNPKTNKWCKPKKSTYTTLGFLFEEPNGHIAYKAYTNRNDFDFGQLTKTQKENLIREESMEEVLKNITWTIKPISSTKESEEIKRNNDEAFSLMATKGNQIYAHKIKEIL